MNSNFINTAEMLELQLEPDSLIQPGDFYLAQRNGEPQLLTAKEIKENYVIPIENGYYCFDVWECVKVTETKKEQPK